MAAGDTLHGHVVLRHGGELVRLAPGDSVPEWADELVTNPKLLEGEDEVEETESEAPGGDGYDDMNKEELQSVLEDRDLPVSGNKDELIERLREDDAS